MSRNPAAADLEPGQFSLEHVKRFRAQVDRVLASPQFRTSRRCQLLLHYVTDRALAGDTAAFKERLLGMAVFGRDAAYDTNQDPIVRVSATEIRKKLAQYYQEPEHEGEIRVSLLPGSYVPEFHIPEVSAPEQPVAPPLPSPPVHKAGASVRPILLAAFLVAVVGTTALLIWRNLRSPLDQFWARMVGSDPILICVGQPAAFNFRSDRYQMQLSEELAKSGDAFAKSDVMLPLKDLIPMPDRYFALGDAVSLVHLVSRFEKHNTPYYIRSSGVTSFNDLREHPAILIGAFDNDWSLRFGARLRFTFQRSFAASGDEIELVKDRDHPERSDWKLVNPWPAWNVQLDYAIISRVLDPSTDRMLVIVAGITQYGTVAAGEFLSNSEYFNQVVPRLPSGWPKKNLQVVLQTPVVQGASGHPKVVASYVW